MSNIIEIYNGLRANYRDSEKRKSDKIFALYPLYRICSFPVAALFIRLGLSANQVTGLGLLTFGLSFAAFVSGIALSFLWGILFYVMSFLFDFADGTVARFHGKPNAFGKLIDGLADSVSFLLFIAVAVANIRTESNLFPAEIEITFGVAATLAALLMQNYEFRVMYLLRESGLAQTKEGGVGARRSGLVQWLSALYRNAITATPLLLLVFAPFGLLSVVLVIFFILHVGFGLTKILVGLATVRRKLASAYRAT